MDVSAESGSENEVGEEFTVEIVATPLPTDWEARSADARRLVVRWLARQARELYERRRAA